MGIPTHATDLNQTENSGSLDHHCWRKRQSPNKNVMVGKSQLLRKPSPPKANAKRTHWSPCQTRSPAKTLGPGAGLLRRLKARANARRTKGMAITWGCKSERKKLKAGNSLMSLSVPTGIMRDAWK